MEPPKKIKKWKGISEKEEKKLESLRIKLQDVKLTSRYDDITLVRFLRARNWKVKKAENMIREDLKWREENKVDFILQNWPNNKYYEKIMNYWPCVTHGRDKEGKITIHWERIGQVDPKSLLSSVPSEDLIMFHLWIMESTEKRMRELFEEKYQGEIPSDTGQIFVQDISGLGWKHLYHPALNIIKTTIEIDESHYPEILSKMYVVNVPKIFAIFWKLISPCIDKKTLEKIEICGSNYLPILTERISIDIIPTWMGGNYEISIGKGGIFSL
jgi:hypothetical protein